MTRQFIFSFLGFLLSAIIVSFYFVIPIEIFFNSRDILNNCSINRIEPFIWFDIFSLHLLTYTVWFYCNFKSARSRATELKLYLAHLFLTVTLIIYFILLISYDCTFANLYIGILFFFDLFYSIITSAVASYFLTREAIPSSEGEITHPYQSIV